MSHLANELAAMANQLHRHSENAKLGGEGVAVRVRDPRYLVDLLRRAARAIDNTGKA